MATVATERDSLSAYGEARSTIEGAPLAPDELRLIDAYWRASLYLCLGMIYLKDNPLLREPLTLDHLKARLLGPLGLRPRAELRLRPPEPPDQEVRPRRDLPLRPRARRAGAALQRLPRGDLLGSLSRQGRGRGRPAEVLQAVLLPGRDRQPLHPRDPRLDPRGGRARLLGLARLRRGVRRPRPARRGHGRRRRGGDRSAGDRLALEQVPQPRPRRRRAAGAAPQRLQDQQPVDPRPDQPTGSWRRCSRGTATRRTSSRAPSPESMHQAMAATLEHCVGEIRAIQEDARQTGVVRRPPWPMIVLRSPKGWTAPREVDGHYLEGFWRSHQVPMGDVRENPAHLKILEQWLRSYSRRSSSTRRAGWSPS